MTIKTLPTQQALLDRALTLSVTSVTGSFSASSTGYARTVGSWFDDKFEVGQEVKGAGWSAPANNAEKVITKLSAAVMTTEGYTVDVDGNRVLSGDSGTVDESAASRTLSVTLPADVELENFKLIPSPGVPWWREEFVTGFGQRISASKDKAEMEYDVNYFITLFLPSDEGGRAGRSYADALLAHFPPGLSLTVPNSSFSVKGNPAPDVGQFVQSVAPVAGFLVVPVTVPLILRTAIA